jgi:phage gp36-like protein
MSAGYASIADLTTFGAPATAFASLTTDQKQGALDAASDLCDSFIRARYPLPLLTWDSTIRQSVAIIAAYQLLVIRGYNPAGGADPNFEIRYKVAMRNLELIQKQQLHPNVTSVPTPSSLAAEQPGVNTSSVVNVWSGATGTTRGW